MALPTPPARPRLPDAGAVDYGDPQAVKAYMQSLVGSLTTALADRPARNVSRHSVLMVSPNGTSYEMTVSDAGAAVFTKLMDPLP